MLIIAVTGLPGAGKSIFSEVAKNLGIPVISMGDLVKEQVVKRGLEITPENVGIIAIRLRKERGPAVVAELVAEKIRSDDRLRNSNVIVVDGVRSLHEVNYLRNAFKKVIVVAIHAPPKKRYERLLARGRTDDSQHLDDIKKRDERELSFGVGNVIALADYILINDSDINSFRRTVSEFLKKLLQKNGGFND